MEKKSQQHHHYLVVTVLFYLSSVSIVSSFQNHYVVSSTRPRALPTTTFPSGICDPTTNIACYMQSASTLTRSTTATTTTTSSTPTTTTNSRIGPLHYRDDRDGIEDRYTEQVTTTRSTTTKTTTPAETSSINKAMIQSICKSQLWMLFGATMIALWSCHGDITQLNWMPSTTKSTTFLDIFNNNGVIAPTSDFWLQQMMTVLIQSIVAAIPMMALSKRVESSSRRDASHVQLANTNLVITLFGRRRRLLSSSPSSITQQQQFMSSSETTTTTPSATLPMVILCSLGIAFIAALSEEILFRVYLPTFLMNTTHSSVLITLFVQAILFGFGHWHTSSNSDDENRMIVSIQTINGLWYGFVYLMSSGNPILCILSHWLYDAHVLANTWNTVNDQMDYTEIASFSAISTGPTSSHRRVPGYNNNDILQQQKKQQQDDEEEANLASYCSEIGPALSNETISLCRRLFYAFDTDRVGCLNIHNVQRAISYAFLNDPIAPTQEQVTYIYQQQINERKKKKRKQQIAVMDPSYNNNSNNNNNNVQTEDNEIRLQFSEFLRLLFTLRSLVNQPDGTTTVAQN